MRHNIINKPSPGAAEYAHYHRETYIHERVAIASSRAKLMCETCNPASSKLRGKGIIVGSAIGRSRGRKVVKEWILG